jgi:hypothetical protein
MKKDKEVEIKTDRYRCKVNSGHLHPSPTSGSHENWANTLYFLAGGWRG